MRALLQRSRGSWFNYIRFRDLSLGRNVLPSCKHYLQKFWEYQYPLYCSHIKTVENFSCVKISVFVEDKQILYFYLEL